ncbi:MAG: IS256 family transposase [Chloroflexi bacterium]|nr:IS256 family transposase [Chloroflexota bacterium]
MKPSYQIVDRKDSQGFARYLAKNGQLLLPLVELIEASRMAVDELIDVLGRASIEAVLQLSAAGVAGERHQGRKGGAVGWHGSQEGKVSLSDRKLRVRKPRLRRKGPGPGKEVEIPAYLAMNNGLGSRLLEILMHNVSTRNYRRVIPEMAESVGISKSSVSRQFIEESAQALEGLAARRFDHLELLIIYLDGLVFGDHHVIVAVGVDAQGRKHVLGLASGASENAASATSLLEDLVERGVDPSRRYLFVIDGSKALRSAINRVFGAGNPVQRCRHHKIKNVCNQLPEELSDQVKAVMKAAYQLPWQEGVTRLKKQAEWLAAHYPGASASLREGLEETFTINRLELPATLRRCLGTTNIIESPHAGVRLRTNRVSRWQDGHMVLRWVAAAFLETEKNFRRLLGYRDLWMLKAKLENEVALDSKPKAA